MTEPRIDDYIQDPIQHVQDVLDRLARAGKSLEWDEEKQTLVIVDGLGKCIFEPPTKRKRGPRRKASALVAKESEHGTVRADKFNHEIAKALQSRNGYGGRTRIPAKINHMAMKPLLMPLRMISKTRATTKRKASNRS